MGYVLVIDDDESIVELLRHYLTQDGYEVRAGIDGRAGLDLFHQETPDIVILDVMLPRLSGTEVCKEIRKTSSSPILMLSAKDDVIDKIVALELGADDYVTKPFEPKELVARVKALHRRSISSVRGPEVSDDVVRFEDMTIDLGRREVHVLGKLVECRPKEFDLLLTMARRPGIVFSREQLLNVVWGYDFEGISRTVDVHVQHLREKLEAAGARTSRITTIWGVGYKFEDPG